MKNRLTKILVATLVCTMALGLFAGCGKSKESETAPVKEEVTTEESEVGMPNPMKEIDAKDFTIPFKLPDGAENVKYFSIDMPNDEPIYEVDFRYNDADWCFRAQQNGAIELTDISGMNYDGASDVEVSYCKGKAHCDDDVAYAYWVDPVPGVNYSLSCNSGISVEQLLEVANGMFVSAQGES